MTAIDQSNANQNKHDNQPVKFDMIYFTLASEGLVLYDLFDTIEKTRQPGAVASLYYYIILDKPGKA